MTPLHFLTVLKTPPYFWALLRHLRAFLMFLRVVLILPRYFQTEIAHTTYLALREPKQATYDSAFILPFGVGVATLKNCLAKACMVVYIFWLK